MDAAAALADLTEISSQVEAAVVVDAAGTVLASSLGDDAGGRLARTGIELLEAAEADVGRDGTAVTQLEVALRAASVFVAQADGRTIVARTSPSPSSNLVFYDLGTCLRAVAEAAKPPKPKRRAPRKKAEAAADA